MRRDGRFVQSIDHRLPPTDMAASPDFLSAALKAQLAPLLKAEGFVARGSRQFVRLRGPLCDSVALQVSQWGDRSFYLHRYVGVLTSPVFTPDSYRVGHRIDRDLQQDLSQAVPWEAADAASAQAAVASLCRVVLDEVQPWFDTLPGLAAWIVEYIADPNSSVDNLDLAAALAGLGRTDRPWWICEALAAETNEHAEMRSAARAFQKVLTDGDVADYLQQIRRRNLLTFKLRDPTA
jgi:hypothetical protein